MRSVSSLDPTVFSRLLQRYLVPMMPGAVLGPPREMAGTWKQKAVAVMAPGSLSVRPAPDASFDCELTRSQRFLAPEVHLVEAFVEACHEVERAVGEPFEVEVLRGLPLRVVARAAGGPHHATTLRILEQLTEWAAWHYEGQPISAAVGIDPSCRGTLDVDAVWREEFAPVLSNGLDTLLVVDTRGRVARLTALSSLAAPSFAPYRFHELAGWATGDRVAVALTRAGEILVFGNRSLRFALRGGRWHHFTHEAAVASLRLPRRRVARNALYETLLDVSFARTGGCVAVVEQSRLDEVRRFVASKDQLSPASPEVPSVKAQVLMKTVGTHFARVDRRIRAELLALDGATLLGHDGQIMAVGAIVRIGAGSTGGGRLAAAKTLCQLGMAAKVSQDGTVLGFDAAGDQIFGYG